MKGRGSASNTQTHRGGSSGAGGGGRQTSYGIDQRKGEVNEIRQLLRNVAVERDPKRRREVIKKVIAYMTLGIDVSRLFTEMVLAIETKDFVIKKMVYHYLCNYAHTKPDLAIMSINTLRRDCDNEDPMVRGLALRSLCSLRMKSILEYVDEPLNRALIDNNAYVRKTGVMGVLKVYHLNPETVKTTSMIDTLYNMLRDVDGGVVMNCLVVLNEILQEEGGFAVNQAIVFHLLDRLSDFDEWGLCNVLHVVQRYQPSDEEEAFFIMNILDPILRTSNRGVVMEAVQCFLHLTADLPDLTYQVYERMKTPLMTLMAAAIPELVYCLLEHIKIMIDRCPGVFDDQYRLFYTKYNEPTNVKHSKIDILAKIANDETAEAIVPELVEYVSDVDPEVSRSSIRALSQIALRVEESSSAVFSKLNELLDFEINYVQEETVLCMKDLLRKFPTEKDDVLPKVKSCLNSVDSGEARAVLVWMLGEYGEDLKEAPYVLENLVENIEEKVDPAVRLALLTACMKLFFKRPPEMQSILGRLFRSLADDPSDYDLKERIRFYYTLLKIDVSKTEEIVTSCRLYTPTFSRDTDVLFKERLYKEFNTLSIIYKKTSDQFIGEKFQIKSAPPSRAPPVPQDVSGMAAEISTSTTLLSDNYSDQGKESNQDVDLLGMPIAPLNGSNEVVKRIELVKDSDVDSGLYQSLWSSLEEASIAVYPLNEIPSLSKVEDSLAEEMIYPRASGDLPDQLKCFLFAKDTDENTYLVQAIINKSTFSLDLVVKCSPSNDTSKSEKISNRIRDTLSDYIIQ